MGRGQKQYQGCNVGRLDDAPDGKHGRKRGFGFGLADALFLCPGGDAAGVAVRFAETGMDNVDQDLIGCDFITQMFGKVCHRRVAQSGGQTGLSRIARGQTPDADNPTPADPAQMGNRCTGAAH